MIQTDVLILGGGLVGSCLAATLAAHGLSAVVVDPADPAVTLAPGFDGRASAVASASGRLLDTVGGAARGVQSLPVGASTVLVLAAVAKGALALAPLRLAVSRVPAVRGLLGLLALALGAYGVLLTVAGLVALTGVLGPVEAPLALAGHALLWDPLFLLWGLALTGWLWLTRPTASTTPPTTEGRVK